MSRADDAQRPCNALLALPDRCERPVQRCQCGLRVFKQVLAFFRQGQVACGAVQQPYPKVLLQLCNRLAGGLRRHALGKGRLPNAPQLYRFGKGGDGFDPLMGMARRKGMFLGGWLVSVSTFHCDWCWLCG